jgi:hypothetical protein
MKSTGVLFVMRFDILRIFACRVCAGSSMLIYRLFLVILERNAKITKKVKKMPG